MAKSSVTVQLCQVQENLISLCKCYVKFGRFVDWISSLCCGIWSLKLFQLFSQNILFNSVFRALLENPTKQLKALIFLPSMLETTRHSMQKLCFLAVSKSTVSAHSTLLPKQHHHVTAPFLAMCYFLARWINLNISGVHHHSYEVLTNNTLQRWCLPNIYNK